MDCPRVLAKICATGKNQPCQDGMHSVFNLVNNEDTITNKYIGMALQLLASNPTACLSLVYDNLLHNFKALASSYVFEYARTAASTFAS